jgi:hypothetical protein
MRPLVEQMMHKRIVIRVDPVRVRSWDHRKLGLAALPVAGSTARYLQEALSRTARCAPSPECVSCGDRGFVAFCGNNSQN